MPGLIPIPKVSEERVRQLCRHFSAERLYELQVGLTGERPVLLLRARQGRAFFRLIVSPFVLSKRVPAWVEEAIATYARMLREMFLGKSDDNNEAIANLDQLYRREKAYHERVVFLSEVQSDQKPLPVAEQLSLREIWLRLRNEYFPDRTDLDSYKIIWSMRRQTRSLATCNVYTRKVAVAHAMNRSEYTPYLEALIYHEMCHAVLGKPEEKNGRRVLHGRDFKNLERRHPGIKLLDSWIEAGGWSKAVRRELRERRVRKALA